MFNKVQFKCFIIEKIQTIFEKIKECQILIFYMLNLL
jgi:hypothetical protein